VGSELESGPPGTPLPHSFCRKQLELSQEQICEHYDHVDLAAALGHATQPGILESEVLLNHPERVHDLGTDVGFGPGLIQSVTRALA